MSEPEVHAPEQNTSRARPDRAEFKAGQRRRRRPGTITRMAGMRLDVFDPNQLDTENYVYRWVNDEQGKLRMATKQDDYDLVNMSDLKDFDRDTTDSEGDSVIKMIVGTDKAGNKVESFLCRKPKVFWEEDMEQAVRFREDTMAGVVHRGEAFDPQSLGIESDAEAAGLPDPEKDKFYVPKGNVIGSAGERKRGPITRKPR